MTPPTLSAADRELLLNALARREGSARELCDWYQLTREQLKQFVTDHRVELEARREAAEQEDATEPVDPSVVTPRQLDELWISNKAARLTRYQEVSDLLYKDLIRGRLSGSELATAAREFRSYAQLAANELGQLLHRGAGDTADGDSLSLDVAGVNIDSMR